MNSKLLRLSLLVCALLACAARGAEAAPRVPQSPLAEARARLDELRKTYADNHPMVMEQKARIAELESRPVTFSIDFAGGSLDDFLKAVSDGKGVSLSIINAGNPTDLQTIQLPAFSLRNTNLMTALQALSRLLITRGFDLTPMPTDVNSIAAVLTRHEMPKPKTPAPIEFESFQLAPYLATQSIDDIVGAIRASWELNPQNDPDALRLKFHPATSILLASGPREGLNMAGKIISQLKQSRPEAQKNPEAVRNQFEEQQKMTEARRKSQQQPGAAATEKK